MTVIFADFSPDYANEIFTFVKVNGVKRTEVGLIASGFHPSYVKAILKKIMRTRGW